MAAVLRRDRIRVVAAAVLMFAFGALPMRFAAAAEPGQKIKLLVLDIELVGDLTDASQASEHEQRLQRVSQLLREEFAKLPAYDVVDATPAKERIEALQAVQYLHKCNGCEIDLGQELGADQVVVAWIHRVSQLILSITYEIREVPSGRPLKRKAFDFRGDNDTGWSRAVTYLVEDLGQSQNPRPPAGD